MGVYINMDMPKKTYAHCMLIKDIDGSVQLHVCTKNSEEISEWEFYDLVPVHEPHGRLGDLTSIEAQLDYIANLDWNKQVGASDGMLAALEVVEDAPTIIPASEEGEHGIE